MTKQTSRPEGVVLSESGADDADLADLYRSEFEPMVRLAYLMTRDDGAAHDIVHDAFCRVAPRVRAGTLERPGGYLRTTVVRLAIDHTRRRTVERRALPRLLKRVPDAEHVPLWDVLDGLSAEQRAVVVLRFWMDLPIAEIALICDCPVSTVNTRLRRSLGALRKVITQ